MTETKTNASKGEKNNLRKVTDQDAINILALRGSLAISLEVLSDVRETMQKELEAGRLNVADLDAFSAR